VTTTQLIPTTILTGFLGSGKTTLLKRVLTEAHGHRIAVIENEFGEENIDGDVILSEIGEQIIQLSNGCICCSIREDLRATLSDLAQRRRAGELAFDTVMIETTGLADPGPLAQTFFLDEVVARDYRPDAILTLVDAVHAMGQLDERAEARRQVGFADHLFISKADLVDAESVHALRRRLRDMNPRASQRIVHFGYVDLAAVFDLGGFNLSPELELELETVPGEQCPSCIGDEHNSHHHHHHHHHDDDIKSFVFRSSHPLHPGRFGQFLNATVQSYGADLLRYKGVLNLAGHHRKVIFQGVHQLMSTAIGDPWTADEERETRLVLIGVQLPTELLLRSLWSCVIPRSDGFTNSVAPRG
jgi:G3E family GTPase